MHCEALKSLPNFHSHVPKWLKSSKPLKVIAAHLWQSKYSINSAILITDSRNLLHMTLHVSHILINISLEFPLSIH